MAELLFNLLLLVVDAAALFSIWQRNTLARRLVAAMGVVAAALLLSAVLARESLGMYGLFGILRLWCWALFVHGVLLSVGVGLISWRKRRWLAVGYLGLAALIAAVGVDAFFIEPTRLQVSRVRLASAKVSRPLTIVAIADFQTDSIGEYERRVLRAAAEEDADLVLFVGDYIQARLGPERDALFQEFRRLLAKADFQPPLGAYAVRGNIDQDDWQELFAGSLVSARNESYGGALDGVYLSALSQPDSRDMKLVVGPQAAFHVAFGHHPDFARGKVAADLLIAGHTHGGQVRLPLVGPLLTLSRIPRRWAAGVTELDGGRTLVVSRGIGMERGDAPRLRFLCRPELVVIEVAPAE